MIDVTWRPYQVECKKQIKDNYDNGVTKQLIVAATGVGKRMMAVNLMQHFHRSLFIAHREELIMQAYNEIQNYFPMNVGIIKGPVFEVDKRIVVASVQTLYNRLDRIDPETFNLVIIDECFPAGTKVNGINIEDYHQGWPISSFNHETNKIEQSIVTRTMKRKYSGKLYDFGQFKCTPNHPIFINEIGYCLASEIYFAYICSIMMRYEIQARFTKNVLFKLWERIWSGRFWKKSENIHVFSPKRTRLLFRKMQEGVFQKGGFYYDEQNKQKVLFRTYEEEQSNVERRRSRKGKKGFEWKNFFKPWRKWAANKTTNYIAGVDPINHRVSYFDSESNVIGKEYAEVEMLQSRFSASRNKTGYRSRWQNSPLEALEILRQTKDGNIEKSRLENIKIYKRASGRKSTKDCKENYVYNLEVAGNNNYFANSVLVHNCHHYAAKTYVQVARHWNPKLSTGWTATPRRLDGLSLSNLFEKMVFQYDIRDGIRDGFLASIEAYQIKTQSDISRVKKTAGDFNLHQLSEAVDSELRNNLIVQKYKQYTPGRQGIAYCVDMDHAYHLRDEFRKNGIKCETVVSDTERCPNRSFLIDRFKGGDIDVLTNVEILTEGFDYPDVGVIMMARPTQSETLYTQCMGRATRLKSQSFVDKYGTDKAIVLDFVDNTGKLSLVNAYELERDVPIADRMFLPAEHKEKLLEEERRRRERRIKLEAGKDRKVDVLQLPKVQVWNSEKMLEPATEKQLQWIRSAGIYEDGVEYTKLQASELISNLPCQEWQIRYLAIHGYDVSKGASIGQYQKVKSNIENKQKYQVLGQDLKPVSKITDTWEN